MSEHCTEMKAINWYSLFLSIYSTNEHKWSTLPEQRSGAAIAVVNSRVTLIGGREVLTRKVTKSPSTWYEDQWKQVLPSTPTGRVSPMAISRDNLLLVTGGVAEVESIFNTTDVLDLITIYSEHHWDPAGCPVQRGVPN